MALPLMRQKSVFAFKNEATLGTAETLAAAQASLRAYDCAIEYPAGYVERQAIGKLGNAKGIAANWSSTVRFYNHLVGTTGSGVAAWTDLLLCSGMSASGAVWTTTDTVSDWKTATCGLWQDGWKRTARAVMFNPSFAFEAGAPVRIDWSGVGAYPGDPLDTSDVGHPGAEAILTGMNYETLLPPLWQGTTNAFTFDGRTDLLVSRATLDLGNQVTPREDPHSDGGYLCGWIGNRLPRLTIDPEVLAAGTYNPFTKYRDASEIDVTIVVGTQANNIWTFTINDAQMVASPGDVDRNGKLCHSYELEVHGSIVIALT